MEGSSAPSGSSLLIPEYILDDLCSRFIINIPEEERSDLIRIFFQIELAHWFYLDFYCQENSELRSCGIKDFSAEIFHHCPTLSEHADNVDKILMSWRDYKMAVPTFGAILLDPNLAYCLLVQGFWNRTSWGFPKGKVNEGEAAAHCAVREVLEETGFDCGHLLDPDEYIEYKMNDTISRLYIVPGVSMDTVFAPRTRNEIKNWDWFRVEHLPAHKRDLNSKTYFDLPANAFFMVMPFIKPLRKWICRRTGTYPDASQGSSSHKQRSGRLSEGNLKPMQLFGAEGGGAGGKASKVRDMSTSPNTASKGAQKQRRTSSPRKLQKKDSVTKKPGPAGPPDGPPTGPPAGPPTGPTGPAGPPPVPDLLDFSYLGKRMVRKDVFCATSWTNFKLNHEAVMSCM